MMPRSADENGYASLSSQVAEGDRGFDKFREGLRKLVAYHREKLARAEAALAALEGKKAAAAAPRINKAVKDFLGKTGGAHTRADIKAALLRAGVISDSKVDSSRLDRSLAQCVNAKTLLEQDGKFELTGS
jgi:hypothetical protein